MEDHPTEEASVRYLSSDEALQSLDRNLYWPKWNSPWWHMSLVHELRKTKRIPKEIVAKMVEKLSEMPQIVFPVHGEGSVTDPYACHCMVGNMFQILWAWGVNVDEELPWMRPFLLNYQMEDGGLSCDHEAYAVTEECPSSMVGTIAVFEALLHCVSRPHTAEERQFLDNAANFLIERQLVLGSSSSFNAEEGESAKAWGDLCFPRFYFYDHLRGLRALLQWAETFNKTIPLSVVEGVSSSILDKCPDGQIVLGRQSFVGRKTKYITDDGEWKKTDAISFELLDALSQVGTVCPTLSAQWIEVQESINRLRASSQVA